MNSLFDDLKEGFEEAIAYEQGKGTAIEKTFSNAGKRLQVYDCPQLYSEENIGYFTQLNYFPRDMHELKELCDMLQPVTDCVVNWPEANGRPINVILSEIGKLRHKAKEQKLESFWDLDTDALCANEVLCILSFPFCSRMGSSWEVEFACSGRLGKYLKLYKEKIEEEKKKASENGAEIILDKNYETYLKHRESRKKEVAELLKRALKELVVEDDRFIYDEDFDSDYTAIRFGTRALDELLGTSSDVENGIWQDEKKKYRRYFYELHIDELKAERNSKLPVYLLLTKANQDKESVAGYEKIVKAHGTSTRGFFGPMVQDEKMVKLARYDDAVKGIMSLSDTEENIDMIKSYIWLYVDSVESDLFK